MGFLVDRVFRAQVVRVAREVLVVQEDLEAQVAHLRLVHLRGCRWEARAESVTGCGASGRCPSFPPRLTEGTTGCGG